MGVGFPVTAREVTDVVVVGAGAIGTACAYELAGAGLRVTVIDRAEPGSEASGASAGLLSAVSSTRSGPFADLCRLSRDLYAPLADALRAESGVDVELVRDGHLELCMTTEEVAGARRLAADQGFAAERLEFVAADDLRRLEPAVAPDALGALLLSRNGWVNSGRLVTALVRAGSRRGIRFDSGDPVEELIRAGDRVTGVRTRRRGRVAAGTVVLAAGVGSSAIAGVPPELRVRPVKGQMLALENTPPRLHHVVLGGDVYLVPRVGGECLIGATVEDGVEDRHVTASGLRWLLREGLAAVPGLAQAAFQRAWTGLRPAVGRGLPVVGPWPGLQGLVVATGHNRSGILLTPVTARLVREWVVDGQPSIPAGVLLPDRLTP